MISITERLRAYSEPVGDGKGTWRKVGLCQDAADTIDALVAALEGVLPMIKRHAEPGYIAALAALAKAKGKQE